MKNIKPILAFKIYRDKEGDYIAKIPALDLMSDASTRKEALETLAGLEAEARKFYKEVGKRWPSYAESEKIAHTGKHGGARKGAGRRSVENPLSETLVISVSKEDKAYLESVSKAEKMPLGAWVRKCILPLRRKQPSAEERKQIAALHAADAFVRSRA